MSHTIPDNYVAMATKQCPVCLDIHEHNAELLIHKRLRSIKEEDRFTGHALCEPCEKLQDDGFIALIETSNEGVIDTLNNSEALRTGRIAHITRRAADDIFDMDLESDLDMVFIETGVIEMLEEMMGNSEEAS